MAIRSTVIFWALIFGISRHTGGGGMGNRNFYIKIGASEVSKEDGDG